MSGPTPIGLDHLLFPPTRPGQTRLFLARLAWLILAGLVLGLYGWRLWESEAYRSGRSVAFTFVMPAGYFVAAGIIFWGKSKDLMGLLAATMLLFAGPYITSGLNGWVTERLPGLNMLLDNLGFASFFLFLLVFPDGRFVPRWTGWIYLANVPIGLAANVLPIFDDPTSQPTQWVMLLAVGMAVLGLAAQIYRYRRHSTPLQRQQTKWVTVGLAGPVIANATYVMALNGMGMVEWLRPGTQGQLILAPLLTLLLPVTLVFAILRHRLWDIDILINRTLVYGALTLAVIGIYVGSVGILGRLVQSDASLDVSLVSTALVAVIFQPLRDRLQRGINRIFYGQRDDPYAVLSRLNDRLAAAIAPASVMDTVAETVAQALKLPYAAISLTEPAKEKASITAAWGTPQSEIEAFPLIYQGQPLGSLLAGRRAVGERFTSGERRLLEDIAHQAGPAIHAVRLTRDLQRSRQRLITAREEERRRLRRDLHDGLGPHLASQTLTLDAVERLLGRDPATATQLLQNLKAQSQEAMSEIRRLIYELRPPVLDNLGLAGAMREVLDRYTSAGVTWRLITEPPLPPLPAAVELAAYLILQEAVQNVVRHAQARSGRVEINLEAQNGRDGLRLCVCDDGRGLPPHHQPGIGLHSMRERAEELGGLFAVGDGGGQGTRIDAWLPLPQEDEDGHEGGDIGEDEA
ncbi:MAG: hypothetical protein KBG20_19210 [Caldilineaceae bacterium]|nr:hypothetical protein [Caldilineaceae bacterium]MBP8108880.1 hypothetical protein [Caldilineaceae bacterium]MBP8124810.1 hypothetical protein [Caldilineaceae bacterium]MBP9074445.1 hypothetical protein [Caldilineaceae bacterium]